MFKFKKILSLFDMIVKIGLSEKSVVIVELEIMMKYKLKNKKYKYLHTNLFRGTINEIIHQTIIEH